MESMGRPLAVRRTAAEEEKAAARAFISLCLSYEGQSKGAKDINSGLSVRRDVLEEQIAAMNEYTELCVSGFDQITLGMIWISNGTGRYSLTWLTRPDR